MEQYTFQYEASRSVSRKAHVGVVGSGDLEITVEPASGPEARVRIRTQSDGFGGTWKALLDRFFMKNDLAVTMEINDFGATPGVVSLRLAQAVEVLES